MNLDVLVERARAAHGHAYAPYSGFRVGAAILVADGSVFQGSNVENASYGLTLCAERAAASAAVAAGHRTFRAVAVVSEGRGPVAPCGACRQVLAEFADDLTVVSESEGRRREWSLTELLPARFERSVGTSARDGDMDR